jgi:hypothetical protein
MSTSLTAATMIDDPFHILVLLLLLIIIIILVKMEI